jgi:hypothetical protein
MFGDFDAPASLFSKDGVALDDGKEEARHVQGRGGQVLGLRRQSKRSICC